MKKIHLNQLLRNRAQFNGVGQLMNATHAIQRALGMEPVAMPMAWVAFTSWPTPLNWARLRRSWLRWIFFMGTP